MLRHGSHLATGPKIKFYLLAIAYLPTILPPTQHFFFFFAFPDFSFAVLIL